MMKGFKACLGAGLILLTAFWTGCKKPDEQAAVMLGDASIKEVISEANPQQAVEEIYNSLEEHKSEPLTPIQLMDLTDLDGSDIDEHYGRISDPIAGISDVIILKPKPDKREEVSLALSKYKEIRIAEFENYDILDAYPIAQGAAIYDQGDYTILLMLADNDSARKIIDKYIPM